MVWLPSSGKSQMGFKFKRWNDFYRQESNRISPHRRVSVKKSSFGFYIRCLSWNWVNLMPCLATCYSSALQPVATGLGIYNPSSWRVAKKFCACVKIGSIVTCPKPSSRLTDMTHLKSTNDQEGIDTMGTHLPSDLFQELPRQDTKNRWTKRWGQTLSSCMQSPWASCLQPSATPLPPGLASHTPSMDTFYGMMAVDC